MNVLRYLKAVKSKERNQIQMWHKGIPGEVTISGFFGAGKCGKGVRSAPLRVVS